MVKILVPIYQTDLNEYEWFSLRHNLQVLAHWPVVFVRPRSVDISPVLSHFPGTTQEAFDDKYFADIAGYNRLMLSADFYRRFQDVDYILVCQLDAYIFEDQLEQWCRCGYDYVGAPWTVPMHFRLPLLKQWRQWFHSKCRTEKDYKVGNGGLSLRKVASHLRVTQQLHDAIEEHLAKPRHWANEDLFLSLEVNKHGALFSYPTYEQALQFSFDRYPAVCYRDNGRCLPFACHGWYKGEAKHFWLPIIWPQCP